MDAGMLKKSACIVKIASEWNGRVGFERWYALENGELHTMESSTAGEEKSVLFVRAERMATLEGATMRPFAKIGTRLMYDHSRTTKGVQRSRGERGKISDRPFRPRGYWRDGRRSGTPSSKVPRTDRRRAKRGWWAWLPNGTGRVVVVIKMHLLGREVP